MNSFQLYLTISVTKKKSLRNGTKPSQYKISFLMTIMFSMFLGDSQNCGYIPLFEAVEQSLFLLFKKKVNFVNKLGCNLNTVTVIVPVHLAQFL